MNPLQTPGTAVITQVEDRGGNFPSQAIQFGGAGCKGVLAYTQPGPLDLTDHFTVEATINLGAANQNTGLVLKGALNNDEGNWELLLVNGNVVVRLNGQTAEGAGQLTGPTIPIGMEIPIRFTYDGQNITIFVNGLQVAQNAYSMPVTLTNVGLAIGNYLDASHGLVGKIYDIRISNVVRDNNQAYVPQPTFNIDAFTAALFRCTEGQGNQIYDIMNVLNPIVLTYPYIWAMRP
jgi:hypothetical protein